MNVTRQFARFSIVGIVSNILLYLLYLLSTYAGLGHKAAMTIMYVLGVLMTFAFNRTWSFSHRGLIGEGLVRYLFVYLLGYLANWIVLYVLVDHAHWPHQWVQAVMVVIIAGALFLSQKFWVFRNEATR